VLFFCSYLFDSVARRVRVQHSLLHSHGRHIVKPRACPVSADAAAHLEPFGIMCDCGISSIQEINNFNVLQNEEN